MSKTQGTYFCPEPKFYPFKTRITVPTITNAVIGGGKISELGLQIDVYRGLNVYTNTRRIVFDTKKTYAPGFSHYEPKELEINEEKVFVFLEDTLEQLVH